MNNCYTSVIKFQSGIYILTLFDWYVGTFPPLFVALGELLVIMYIYGKYILYIEIFYHFVDK